MPARRADWVKAGAVVIDVGINVQSPPSPLAVLPQTRSERAHALDSRSLCVPPLSEPELVARVFACTPLAKIVGDVAFEEVLHVASAITPVPGGVGPMTIAAVLHNVILAARYSAGLTKW